MATSHNILITESDIKKIFIPYAPNIKVNDVSIYQQALVHISFVEHCCNVGCFRADESYDVLEWRGDSILKCVVSEYLHQRFPQAKEDRLTQLIIGIIRGETLALLGKRIGLGRFVLVAQSIDETSKEDCRIGRQSDKVLEDAFEAFLAALLTDQGGIMNGGMPIVYSFIVALLEQTLNFEKLLSDDQNPKGTLCSYCIARRWDPPNLISLVPLTKTNYKGTGKESNSIGYAVTMKRNQVEKWLDPLAQSLLEDKIMQDFESLPNDEIDLNEEIVVSLSVCHQPFKKKQQINEAYLFAMQRFSNGMTSQQL